MPKGKKGRLSFPGDLDPSTVDRPEFNLRSYKGESLDRGDYTPEQARKFEE